MTLWVIHLFEWKNPGKIIRLMRDTGPSVVKAVAVEK
jgi:hypothetical protein